MGDAVGIRDAVEADLIGIIEVISGQPLWSRYGYTRERQERDLCGALGSGDHLLVAIEGDECLGVVWIQPEGVFGRSPYLRLIAVRRGHEGRGLGGRLLAAAEERVAGIPLFLLVSEDNVLARAFYQRQGYRRVGRLPGYVREEIVELLYWGRGPRQQS